MSEQPITEGGHVNAVESWRERAERAEAAKDVLAEAYESQYRCTEQAQRNTAYYADLLDQASVYLGRAVYLSDDGSVQADPLRAKVPQLVGDLHARAERAEALVARMREAIEAMLKECRDDVGGVYSSPATRALETVLADPLGQRTAEEWRALRLAEAALREMVRGLSLSLNAEDWPQPEMENAQAALAAVERAREGRDE